MEHAGLIFGTSNAGPAAYLAEVISTLGTPLRCLASPVSARIFAGRGIRCEQAWFETQEEHDRHVVSALRGISARGIVAGTCWGPGLDPALVRFGRDNGIPVVSVVDHWSFYRERFNNGGRLELPDHILVIDEQARKDAIAAGLPGERLHALGHPMLERRATASSGRSDAARWRASLGIAEATVIAFLSEDYAKHTPPGHPAYPGFDEFRVLEDILRAAPPQAHVLVKLHPLEEAGKFNRWRGTRLSVVADADLDALISHADAIIGMGTMLLLEAATRRGDVLSYRPDDRQGFIGNEIGATSLIRDEGSLRTALARPRERAASRWGRQFKGSTRRISDFLNEVLR